MKKTLKITVSVLLCLLFCAAAIAESLYATGDVNIRKGPGLGYSAVISVNKGSVMTYLNSSSVDSRGVTWYKVQVNGQTGWVSSVYASFSPAVSGTVKASGGSSNLRTGPGLGYSDLGVFKKGSSADWLGKTSTDSRGVDWYYIRYNGQQCWVSSRYTTLIKTGEPATSYGTVKATGGKSNLRSGPGLSYKDIGTFQKGESATWLGKSSRDDRGYDWYYINYKGTTCWVSSRYTTLYK